MKKGIDDNSNLVSSAENNIIHHHRITFRALQTMIDLGRITALCSDCPQAGALIASNQPTYSLKIDVNVHVNIFKKAFRSTKFT